MKILFFDDFKLGVLKGDAVVDVSDTVRDIPHTGPHNLISGLIERFADYKRRLEEAVSRGKSVPLGQVKIRPPLPKPTNIECMAVNYMEDGTRSEPAPINAFHKSPSAIIGPEDTMVLPDVPATIFEGEAEVALVIGKRASNVRAADAMSYVFGYTNFIDGSARGLLPAGNTFYQMKSRDTFAPIGPWIVTADEIVDPHKLQVRLWVNGELKQNFNTSDMAHKIPRCIEWVTSIHTLEPGDILATGTNHRGLSGFQNGDRIELETEGLGRLRFNVRDDLKRTWSRETRLDRQQKGQEGKTPPWKAVPGYGEFADVRRLSDEEIALVTRWVHDGAPEGDPRDLPPPRKFPTGWALGRPGAVLAMTKPFTIPARTRDIYRCFAVPITIPGEWRFIRASEVLPGNRKVVHHAQPPRPPWTPGFQPLEIPSGVAWGIPPGARLVMQVHYNNPGDAVETDLTRVGLHFTSGPFDRRLNRVRASAWNFSIPAGAPRSSVVATAVVQDELLALSVHGHMHLLGREMRVTARFPDGTRQPLLHIDDWDFEWQLLYSFKRPMALPSGTVIEAECVYDNSADNPNNPSSPPRVVRSGFETTDEMCQANVLGTMRLTRR